MNHEGQIEIIATNLIERRRQLFLSRAYLAEKVGVTKDYIYKLEEGKRSPSINVLMNLAHFLYIDDWRRLLYKDMDVTSD